MKLPLPERVALALLAEMASGHYQPGTRFLSHREVKRTWKVSSPTATLSLKRLVDWGILEPRDRSGHYLSGDFRKRALLLLNENSSPPLPRKLRWQNKVYKTLHEDAVLQRIAVLILIPGRAARPTRDDALKEWIGRHTDIGAAHSTRSLFNEAREHGVIVDFFASHDGASASEKIVAQIVASRAQGVILINRTSASCFTSFYEALRQHQIPLVSVFEETRDPSSISINFNNIAMGYMATHALLAKGHRRIGVALYEDSGDYFLDRLLGSQLAINDAIKTDNPFDLRQGPSVEAIWLKRGRPQSKTAYKQLRRNSPERITAVLLTLVEHLGSLRTLLEEEQYEIPDDLSVIVCSISPETPFFPFPLDIMQLDFAEIGRLAFQALRELFAGRHVSPCLLANPHYRPHGTVRPLIPVP